MDWTTPNLVKIFKLFKQWIGLYFIVNKKKKGLSNILLQVGDEGLKWYNSWMLMKKKRKVFQDINFGKFLEQLELIENYWVSHLINVI